jgi:hypothetical protein
MDFGVVVELKEPWAPPDVDEALTLDRQGLSCSVQPLLGEPSRSFLGGEGALARGANELAWSLAP